METEQLPDTQTTTTENGESWDRRRRFYSRLFVGVMIAVLPITVLALWLLTWLVFWKVNVDAMGLLATSVGILGILVFFMFLYKYQIIMNCDHRGRVIALVVHGLITLALFLGCIWLAYDSPWTSVKLWGDYDMLSTAKPWIISVLVVGTISLLGSLFDLVRKRLSE
jgi:heme/copper-type cytochrome/quinol oxidase subunit 4